MRFKNEALERCARIEQLTAGTGEDRFGEIREESHKLKGAAGMFGFPELQDRAAELEQLVAGAQSGQGELAAAV
ncbi:MAG: Hpt domain-containing protein, partial [Thermoleophilia bacterium]|nr:Hpt domain-containing protein [Thermoleophilia bacterium]